MFIESKNYNEHIGVFKWPSMDMQGSVAFHSQQMFRSKHYKMLVVLLSELKRSVAAAGMVGMN